MDYNNIEKNSIEDLKKLYTILNDIYCKFIIDEDFTDLRYGDPKGLNGVSAEDQKEIIAQLIWEKILIGYYKDVEYIQSEDYPEGYYAGGYILEFTQEFLDLYVKVRRKIREQIASSSKPVFHEEKSILSFRGYKIQIAKQNKKTIAHRILKHIFDKDNLEELSAYVEIEGEEYQSELKLGKKYHAACQDIQKKIEKQTNGEIKDFLVFSSSDRGEVSINKSYL